MRQRRHYEKSFKGMAVTAVRDGRSVNSVAEILGVPRRTLRGWLSQALPDSETPRSQRRYDRINFGFEVTSWKALKVQASISLQVAGRTAARDTRR